MTDKHAIPLLLYDKNSKSFTFSEEAELFLKSLDKPFGVLTVAGMYRTGKSYLLNKIFLGKKGFSVGPTVNPCTKGLWIWPELHNGNDENGNSIDIVLLDTEGFGAYDEDINHDTKIFTLSILLSSFFVYNSVGTIDEKTIQSLSFVVNISKHIQMKSSSYSSNNNIDELSTLFPKFCWVLRDFSLRLQNKNGGTITSDEYLDSVLNYKLLESEIKTNPLQESKNDIRNLIKTYFKDRKCVTLVRPVEDEQQLQKLQSLDDSELRPEFIKQISCLRDNIMNNMRVKCFNGKKVDGEIYISMIKSFSSAINSGVVPNIETTWTSICRMESFKAYEKAEKLYDSKMSEIMKNINKKDMSKDEFHLIHKEIENECMQVLDQESSDFNNDNKTKLKRRIKDKFTYFDKIFDEELKILVSKYLSSVIIQSENKFLTILNSDINENSIINKLMNEVSSILKETEVNLNKKYNDFQSREELFFEFKNKLLYMIIDLIKKLYNNIDIKLKEFEHKYNILLSQQESDKLQFSQEISNKNKELLKLNTELKLLNQSNTELKSKITEINNEKVILKSENANNNQSLQQTIKDQERKLKEKEHLYNITCDKLNGAEFKLTEKEKRIAELENNNTHQNSIYNEKIKELKQKEKELFNSHQDKLKESENKIENYKNELIEHKEKMILNDKEIKQKLIDYDTITKKQALQINSFQENKNKQEIDFSNYQKEKEGHINNLILENNKLKDDINNEVKQCNFVEDNLNVKIILLEESNQILIQKQKTLLDNIKDLKNQKERDLLNFEVVIEEHKNKYEELQNSYELIKKQNEETIKQIESKALMSNDSHNDKLIEFYEEAIRNNKIIFENDILQLKNEIIQLKNKSAESSKTSNKIDQEKDIQIEELKNDKDSLRNQIQKLIKEKNYFKITFKE